MKVYFLAATILLFSCTVSKLFAQDDTVTLSWVNSRLDHAAQQYRFFADSLAKINQNYEYYPRSISEQDRSTIMKPLSYVGWTGGFFIGSLWLLYEYTENEYWRNEALQYCENLLDATNVTPDDPWLNCDLGFVFFTALVPAYQYTNDVRFRNKLIEASDALKARFHPVVGATDSWDFGQYASKHYVIIDNMMSMDLLFWATQETGDSSYYHVAVAHANTMIKHQYRDDFSTFNAEYDTITGNVIGDTTHKHLPDQHAWSRGQTWGFNAFTMYYRETNVPAYLEMAENTAGFWMNHENLPDDLVPYWNISDPLPGTWKEAASTTIFADGALLLSNQSQNGEIYLEFAKNSLVSLSAATYLAQPGQNNGFLIMNVTGGTDEHETSTIYADFYYIRSLMYLREILQTTSIGTIAQNAIKNFYLHQNYPNPFNSTTNIEFTLRKKQHVILNVYNSLGKNVGMLVNKVLPAGSYKVKFEGKNLASGVYYFRLTSGGIVQSIKSQLLK